MPFSVVILESATQDLKDLQRSVSESFSADAWRNAHDKIRECIRNLKVFPYAGSIPDELENLGLTQYRQILSGMNRIIYEVRMVTIYIHMIGDARRDMKSLLTKRLFRPH
jgi:plasmid stabilization system protein ParE